MGSKEAAVTRVSVIRVSWAAAATGALIVGGLATASFAGASVATVGPDAAGPHVTSPDKLAPDIITTVAGGVGGPDAASSVALSPCGLRFADDALLVGTGDAIRRINPATGWLTNVAGDGANGDAGDFNVVELIAARSGTYFGRSMKAGDIYTIAGTGKAGYSGDGGPATIAQVSNVVDAAVDGHGNVLLSDVGRIRVVAASTGTFYGQAMTAGDIYAIAGMGTCTGLITAGAVATTTRADAVGLAIGPGGGVVFTDGVLVYEVAATAGTFYGRPMQVGRVYPIGGSAAGNGFGDGDPATKVFLNDNGLAVTPAGAVLLAERLNFRIRSIVP
jgi:hypothetical protein